MFWLWIAFQFLSCLVVNIQLIIAFTGAYTYIAGKDIGDHFELKIFCLPVRHCL